MEISYKNGNKQILINNERLEFTELGNGCVRTIDLTEQNYDRAVEIYKLKAELEIVFLDKFKAIMANIEYIVNNKD